MYDLPILRIAMSKLILCCVLCVSFLFFSFIRTDALTLKSVERIRLPSYLSTNMEPPTIFAAGNELWFIFNVRNFEFLELQKRNANDLSKLISRHRTTRPDPNLRFFALRKAGPFLSGLSDNEGIVEYIFDRNLTPIRKRQLMRPESISGPCNGSSGRLVLYAWNAGDSLGLFTRARPCDAERMFEANLFSPSKGIVARTRRAPSNIFIHNIRSNEYLFHSNDRVQLLGNRLQFRSRNLLQPPTAVHRIVYNRRDNIYLDVASDDHVTLKKYNPSLKLIPGGSSAFPLSFGEFVNQAFHNARRNQYFLAIPEVAGQVNLRIVALSPSLKSISNSFQVSRLQFADVQSLTLMDGSQLFMIWERSGPVLYRLVAH